MTDLLREMLLSGSIMVLVIVVLRAVLLHRLPKRTFLLLWELALLRFLIPFSIPSPVSVFSAAGKLQVHPVHPEVVVVQTVQELRPEPTEAPVPEAEPELPVLTDEQITALIAENSQRRAEQAEREAQEALAALDAPPPVDVRVLPIAWAVGALVCLAGFGAAYLLSLNRFRFACLVKDPGISAIIAEQGIRRRVTVRSLHGLSSPLTYGLLRPVILLPEGMDNADPAELRLILTHECMHIRRMDCLRKVLVIVAVSLYWFDPLMWVLYLLYNRDMELSCDECVVQRAAGDCRKAYAMTLIGMAEKQSFLSPLHSHFGQNAIEERIVAIMKHKRYGYTATGISCLLAAAIMGALGTSAAAQEVYTAVPGEASMQLFPYDVGVSDRIMAGENGECLYERDLSSFGFVVVASKGLRPEDFVFSDPEEPECRYVDMWYSYVSSLNQNGGESTEYVDDVSRTIRERYGQTPYLYYVRCDVGTSERRAASMARAFVADNAGAVDAIVVGQRAAGTCVWDGAFRVGYKKDKDSGPLPYYLDCEDEIKATLDWDQTAWLAQYRRIREQHPDDTPEQLCQRLAGAGLRSPWDVTAGACRAAQAYTEAHAEDVSVIARIDYENLRYVLEETESARSIGDTNKDGAVDASDAAQILTISALAGTSGAKLSEELRYFYDVNADGEINASDAALILQYAAASGTTFRGTMSDYMQVR